MDHRGIPGTWLGWRAMLALLAAMLAPLMIYILITTAFSYRQEQRATEAQTLAKARQIIATVDDRLVLSSATMRALATTNSIRARDWDEAEVWMREIARLQPDWRGVALLDHKTRRVLADNGECEGKTSVGALDAGRIGSIRNTVSFSDIDPVANRKPELRAFLNVSGDAGERYLLIVCLDPVVVQRALLSLAPREGVSAVVDRHGRFIARTKGWRVRPPPA